jgi:SAM-dependent methyltransferase
MASTTAFDRERFAACYPPGIERHYWTLARNRLIAHRLGRLRAQAPKALDCILEIGCGRGIVVRALRREGFNAFGSDLAAPDGIPADVEHYLTLGADALALPVEFRESVTTLLLLDVLEHIEDTEAFLAHCSNSFPRCRCLFVTVPARVELWSNYDEYYGHFSRYTRSRLLTDTAPEGWRARGAGYFFHALYLAGMMQRLRGGKRSIRIKAPGPAARPAHAALAAAFFREYKLLPDFIPGSSCWAEYVRTEQEPCTP